MILWMVAKSFYGYFMDNSKNEDFDSVDGRRNPAPLGWLKPTPK